MGVYPDTNFEVSTEELYRLLGSMIYPDVRQKIVSMCLPGRIALQLICQHILIHAKDYQGAKLYAVKIRELFSMIDKCVDDSTPWPFAGLARFVRRWDKT